MAKPKILAKPLVKIIGSIQMGGANLHITRTSLGLGCLRGAQMHRSSAPESVLPTLCEAPRSAWTAWSREEAEMLHNREEVLLVK